MKTIGIVAHSAEGGALCFLTACREGGAQIGTHMHPTIVVSAIPMGLSLSGWESGEHAVVEKHLSAGVKQVADAGADFYVCPDNTAHIVLEQIASELPLPGLHIAEVVCHEIAAHGWTRAGLLGTKWTMTGPVYEKALAKFELERIIPDEPTSEWINDVIFDELCQGIFEESTRARFVETIGELKSRGADCVILGCTEIPLIVTPSDSPIPTLDSTRLLARDAVREARSERPLPEAGWIEIRSPEA